MPNWQMWIEQNYKVIAMWARRWHPEEWRELIAFMTFYLQKNWAKFSLIPDGEQRIKFLQTWMKNNVKWQNSDFNKSIAVNNLGIEYYSNEEWDFEGGSRVQAYEERFDVIAEDMSDDVKAFIIDLERRFSEQEVEKIIKVRKIYLTLPSHEKVLYDLYFTKMLSIRGVAKQLDLPLSSVHNMILQLRKKIQDLC
jgi:hypothetical protein